MLACATVWSSKSCKTHHQNNWLKIDIRIDWKFRNLYPSFVYIYWKYRYVIKITCWDHTIGPSTEVFSRTTTMVLKSSWDIYANLLYLIMWMCKCYFWTCWNCDSLTLSPLTSHTSPSSTMQCWGLLDANEQKNGGFNIVHLGSGWRPYVNNPT